MFLVSRNTLLPQIHTRNRIFALHESLFIFLNPLIMFNFVIQMGNYGVEETLIYYYAFSPIHFGFDNTHLWIQINI